MEVKLTKEENDVLATALQNYDDALADDGEDELRRILDKVYEKLVHDELYY